MAEDFQAEPRSPSSDREPGRRHNALRRNSRDRNGRAVAHQRVPPPPLVVEERRGEFPDDNLRSRQSQDESDASESESKDDPLENRDGVSEKDSFQSRSEESSATGEHHSMELIQDENQSGDSKGDSGEPLALVANKEAGGVSSEPSRTAVVAEPLRDAGRMHWLCFGIGRIALLFLGGVIVVGVACASGPPSDPLVPITTSPTPADSTLAPSVSAVEPCSYITGEATLVIQFNREIISFLSDDDLELLVSDTYETYTSAKNKACPNYLLQTSVVERLANYTQIDSLQLQDVAFYLILNTNIDYAVFIPDEDTEEFLELLNQEVFELLNQEVVLAFSASTAEYVKLLTTLAILLLAFLAASFAARVLGIEEFIAAAAIRSLATVLLYLYRFLQ